MAPLHTADRGNDVQGEGANVSENATRPHQCTSESPERARGEYQQDAEGEDAQSGMGEVSSDAEFGYEIQTLSPLRDALLSSTVQGHDPEVASGHDDASPNHDDGNFDTAKQNLSEDNDIGQIANGLEESTNVSDVRLMPLHSSRTDQTEILSPQVPPKLPTIKEEAPSPCEIGSNVLVTRGNFPKRERSLSMSETLEASNSKDIPTPPPKRLPCAVLQGPKPTRFTKRPERPPTMIITINEILSSMGRLEPGHF
ncbi:hypothetical protein GQ607_013063 [Colletotrichum asianum]|uniref:Uncharacterized protein n=1 Tax=Colletotrichum asianum TaxID=702518 RepID=A0A8H3W7P3_9PEZI|nr:hypothetical protein GQ607_013063 [Colletotrichum asianum]